MNLAWCATGLCLIALTAPSVGTVRPVPRMVSACNDSDLVQQVMLRKARFSLTLPEMTQFFAGSGLGDGDQDRIELVHSDSLCRKAVLAINRDLQTPDSTVRHVDLLQVGKTYWASDRNEVRGEFTVLFVLDSTLTRVLKRGLG